MRFIYTLLLVALIFTTGWAQTSIDKSKTGLHKVTAKEVIQSNAYTYMLVVEDEKEWWIAAPKITPVIGAVYYYLGEMEMKNFKSKELNRTFDMVNFVEGLLFEDIYEEGKFPVKGGATIADLYIYKDDYEDKVVKVRGKVTKFNEDIMGKNWIHLNDGTNVLGNRDFIVTSQASAKVGEVVTFEGKLSKHVDLGSGYTFEVLMEDAKVLK